MIACLFVRTRLEPESKKQSPKKNNVKPDKTNKLEESEKKKSEDQEPGISVVRARNFMSFS